MANWRDIKKAARGAIHGTFSVPAVYLVALTAPPLRVNVRDHTRIAPRENEFTWPASPGFLEMTPKVIFSRLEVDVVLRDAFVIFSPTEMYRTGASEPDRAGYNVTECSVLTPAECAAALVSIGSVAGIPEWAGILYVGDYDPEQVYDDGVFN